MSAPADSLAGVSRRVRIASVNVNGIRAATRKGMLEWLDAADIDVMALQEVRATEEELRTALPGWEIVNDEALSKGRAGVAVASRLPFVDVRRVLGPEPLDSAGRWIEADFDIDGERLIVVSAYVHTGEADTPKQDAKWAFLDAMEKRMPQLAAASPLALVMGDLNVGHREFDIRNWKGNVKKAGLLPRERAYFDRFFGEHRTRGGRRRPPLPRRRPRPVHVVVDARARVRQRHRVAHRLPPRHARPGRARRRLPRRARTLVGYALERPLPRRRGLHDRALRALRHEPLAREHGRAIACG